MIARIVIAVLVGTMPAAAWSQDGITRFSVAFRGAIAMEKLPYKGPLIFEAPDGEEVYISSCGFANITYRTGPVLRTYEAYSDEEGEPHSFMYLMGEFCRVSDALLEQNFLSLIAYYEREGVKYLAGNPAAVYSDHVGSLYVVDADFVEASELQALTRPIAHGENDEGCFDPDVGAPTEGRVMVEGRLCFAAGVYLSDIAGREVERHGD